MKYINIYNLINESDEKIIKLDKNKIAKLKDICQFLGKKIIKYIKIILLLIISYYFYYIINNNEKLKNISFKNIAKKRGFKYMNI